ncbi:MAG: DUF2271 domain-containing protein [Pseudomonadota bacterium]
MKKSLITALAATLLAAAAPAIAADLTVKVTVPQLNVAEYHRPYVAVWLESDAGKATTLAVWYDTAMKNNEGTKWLKDLRQWWRKSGRELTVPIDGVTGATKPAGEHTLVFSGRQAPLAGLPAGQYRLVVEAAREVGGREVVQIPFTWPPKKAEKSSAAGKEELGALILELKP